jgi:two-component system chemotaxis response regulator CheY
MFADRAARRRPSDGLAKRTALIVEDNPRLQRIMSNELARMNFGVISASHCDAAIRHLEARKAHIVCIDIGLPNKSGYELCEYIRDTMGLTRMPILATGEYGNSHDLARAEEAGANAFLLKPFSIPQLTHCVEALLDLTPGRTLPMRELALRDNVRGYVMAKPALVVLAPAA